MKILHQLGHNYRWALDSFFQNQIGDGFIISALSISKDKVGNKLSGYESDVYLPLSMVDLQFYGSKVSRGKNLKSYEFHPVNYTGKDSTEVSTVDAVISGIKYQENLKLETIIIPTIYIEPEKEEARTQLIQKINDRLEKHKTSVQKQKRGVVKARYFMTVPISKLSIQNDQEIEHLLQDLTDMNIVFDGYYIVCEPDLQARKKISVNLKYYINLNKILSTLKKQGFQVILGFSNVDSLVFAAMNDLDYISIGTYEVLRNFNIRRFIDKDGGGPSKGWYYSEKLLNFVKAQQLDDLRDRGALDLIRNDENIFSDAILQEGYDWSIHRPDVHKNYLLAVSRQLKKIASFSPGNDRIEYMIKLVNAARETYRQLEDDKGLFLDDESSSYHLPKWLSVLKAPTIGVSSK